jgi:ribosomal protein S18 acetylase RimI-like enzyme
VSQPSQPSDGVDAPVGVDALVLVDALDVEAVAALGWRGLVTEALGGWLLRAAGGFTGRANSVLPLGDPGVAVDDALDHVVQWYAAQGLPARVQVPLPPRARLDEELDLRGWTARDPTAVLVSPVAPLVGPASAAGPAEADDEVLAVVDAAPDDAWVAGYHYRGGTLPAHARAVLVNADRLAFASLRAVDDGAVLAIARGSVDAAPDGRRWLGVTAVEVAPDARRRGYGTRILGELARWAQVQGATACYLQVALENTPALRLYAGAGFVQHHSYQYRLGPESVL